MDDKNKKTPEDQSLNLEDLDVVVGGGGMQEDAEANPTTAVSSNTQQNI